MFPFGAHACVVDVDAETGKVEIVRYVAVDDCGPAINPMLIDGQVHGGIAHGHRAGALRACIYDDDGQLVTGTFVDYALPSAADVPSFETDRTETPSPVNSLGVKGVGEAGTIAAPGDRDNAVIDALRPLGVDCINMPLTPMRIWQAIHSHDGPRATEQGRDLGRARQRHRRLRTDHPGRGRCAVIPPEFDYAAPESLDEALRALADGGEDAKLLAGGHSLLPLMKLRLAAPTLLVDLRKVPGLRGAERDERRLADRRDDAPRRPAGPTPTSASSQHAASLDRRPAGPQPRHDRRLARPRRPGLRPAAVLLALEGVVTVHGRRRRDARGRGGRPVPGLPDDGGRRRARSSPRSTCRRSTATASATRSSTAAPRTGRWSASCALVKKAGDGSCEDVRIGLTHMGSTPLRATAAEDALRGRALDAQSIASAAEQAAEGTEPPADLNATPDYKRHLARVLTRRALEQAAGVSS